MKKTYLNYLILAILLFPFATLSQLHWVKSDTTPSGASPSLIKSPSGQYALVQQENGIMHIRKSQKNRIEWKPNYMGGNSVSTNSSQVVPFYFNGILYTVYNGLDSKIHFSSWDGTTFNPDALTSIGNTSLYYFDIAVNPVSNKIYFVCNNTAGSAVDLYQYDAVNNLWNPVFSNLQQNAGIGFVNPKIYFNSDTMYISGISQVGSNKLFVLKNKTASFDTSSPRLTINSISQEVDDYDMAGEAGNPPFFVGFNNLNMKVIVSKSNATGSVDTLRTIQESGIFYAYTKITVSNGKPSITYFTDDGNGSGNILAYRYDGINLVPFGTQNILHNFVTGAQIAHLDIQQQNGRTFIGFDKQFPLQSYLYATNNLPTVASGGTPNNLCQYSSSPMPLFSNIKFTDVDGDSITIVDIISDNASVVSNGIANFTVLPLGNNAFKISTYPGNAGSAMLTIKYSDGLDTNLYTKSVTVKSVGSVNIPTSFKSCTNADEINLNTLVAPYTGTFDYYGMSIQDGIAQVSMFQETDPMIYFYCIDTSGCTIDYPFNISLKNPPIISSVSTTPSNCGTYNGTASFVYSSDNGVSDIYWTNGKHDSLTVTGLAPGQYTVSITDTINCRTSAAVNIDLNGISISGTSTPVSCFGGHNGSIDITVSGATGAISYLWSNGKSTEDISGLAAGTYTVIIHNPNGCDVSKDFVVAQKNRLFTSIYSSNANCGSTDGSANVSVISGGTPPYTYLWNTGETNATLSNVGLGTYNVSITDSAGCSVTASTSVSELGTPSIYTNSIVQPSCGLSNGSIEIGLANYADVQSVSWSNGEIGTFLIDSLTVGDYTFNLTTTTGCKGKYFVHLTTKAPETNPICLITVDTNTTTNLLVWEKAENNIDYYNIYREGSTAGEYMLIDTVSGLNYSIFNDVVAAPKIRSWRYKISAVNQCGIESALSPHHQTIHVVINQVNNTQFSLSWNKYVGFEYNTQEIWRFTNALGWVNITSVANNITSYTDNVLTDTTGIDYMIEVSPQSPCTVDKAQDYNSSRSNKCSGHMLPGIGTGASNNGIAEYGKDLPISIFPNPTNSKVNVVWEGQPTSFRIVDVHGKKILSSKLPNGNSIIDLSNLESGLYFMHVNGGIKKIVVQ
jgi:hypothetical protein